ncbi:hypothetical protein K7X08_032321 [Anisodus acutangulus]|uniref:Uncharacterized protein n=1 Tax=Anisodus acutangulus TaxID=402998 RepID=A0A9Q1LK71_9SOLA|nr:hypothetical protein K7X08_032321 [Anisodus acutangulus]
MPCNGTTDNFRHIVIKEEMADQQTTIIMGQLQKCFAKEISTALEPVKTTTKEYHKLLHAHLDEFEFRLATLNRSGPSSDVGSLLTELHELRATVQALQAHDYVMLEDLTQTTLVDLAAYIQVQHMIEDDDSPIATPADTKGKRK